MEKEKNKTMYTKNDLIDFVSNFPKEIDTILDDIEIQETIKIEMYKMFKLLMFGIDNDLFINSKKTDFVKNKQLLFNYIFMPTDLITTSKIISDLLKKITFFVEETEKMYDFFSGRYISKNSLEDDKNTIMVFNRFNVLISSYTNSLNCHILSNSDFASSIKNIYDFDIMSIDKKQINSFFKEDSLKRHYFNHVYSLKNNIKVFDSKDMFFGEINNLMRIFNNIFDFIFGDFIALYKTIETLNDSLKIC